MGGKCEKDNFDFFKDSKKINNRQYFVLKKSRTD